MIMLKVVNFIKNIKNSCGSNKHENAVDDIQIVENIYILMKVKYAKEGIALVDVAWTKVTAFLAYQGLKPYTKVGQLIIVSYYLGHFKY